MTCKTEHAEVFKAFVAVKLTHRIVQNHWINVNVWNGHHATSSNSADKH